MTTTFRIHWLSVTIFKPQPVEVVWQEFFGAALGSLADIGHGGTGFRKILRSPTGAAVYCDPIQKSDLGDYVTFVLNGSSCDCLTPDVFRAFWQYLRGGVVMGSPFRVTRLDLAWDGVPFSPEQFYEALEAREITCRASRKSIRWETSPYAERENGEIGTATAYIGARSSERMVRVYNKRGETRLEFQLRGDWANAVYTQLMIENWPEWKRKGISALLSYIRVHRDWWAEFVADVAQMDIAVKAARRVALSRVRRWFDRQVTPALYALAEVMGEDEFWAFVRSSAKRGNRLARYGPVMEMA